MQRTALVPLAPGFEEMEAVIIVDVLRRAGIEVALAGLGGAGPVLGSRGITASAEVDFAEVEGRTFDAIVLPGGMGGTVAMRDDGRVIAAVRRHAEAGKLVAAVCAAPLVLARAGVLDGRVATSHPGVRDELEEGGQSLSDERVVRDGDVLTSQGPGTAMEFALAVVEALVGAETAHEVGAAMCFAAPV